MSALERLLASVLLLLALLAGAWVERHHYGAAQYAAGHAAAVAEGDRARHDAETANLAIESGLRDKLLDKDIAAHIKEQDHEQKVADAQRRVRTGVDSLRCPASTVQPGAPAASGSATAGPAADGQGPALVPEAAADVLGVAADVAGLVRRYERVVERYDECRAVNNQP